MDIIEKARVKAFHRNRLNEIPSKALGFRVPENQLIRFEQLCRWGDISDLTVMDLGCGYGDLSGFLHQHFTNVNYLGIDFLSDFIDTAEEYYGHLPNTQFICADFLSAGLPEVDLVIASGSLNYRSVNELHPWQTIAKMWQVARKGVAFNLLDKSTFPDDELLVGYELQEVLSFCQKLNPSAVSINGYLPDDFTIFMHK